MNGRYSKLGTTIFLNKISRIKPDIIHLHDIHGYYINLKVLFDYLRESNIPVVWTHHDCWCVSGSSAYFDYYGCKHFDEGCVMCNNTREYPSSPFLTDMYVCDQKNYR